MKKVVIAYCTALALMLVGMVGSARADLRGHWTFDDGTANDSSSYGNHGAFGGTATVVNDPTRGNVLSLDGAGKVEIGDPASLQIVGEITVAAWVKAAAYGPGGQNNIVNKGHDDSGLPSGYRREFTLRVDQTGAEYDFGTWESGRSPGNQMATAANPGDVNRWVHMAGTAVFDGGTNTYTWHLYRNGVEIATDGPYANGMLPVNYRWAIGARGLATADLTNIQRGFDGLIDDVRIYSTALSGEEIAAIVPEPTTVCLLACGGLAVLRRKRS